MTQFKRGGGTMCIHHAVVAKQFRKIVKKKRNAQDDDLCFSIVYNTLCIKEFVQNTTFYIEDLLCYSNMCLIICKLYYTCTYIIKSKY